MGFKPIPAAIALALTLILWFIPAPEGVAPNAWHLLALFIGIIAGIIGKAMPIGAMAMLAMTIVALLQVTVPELGADGNPIKNPAAQAAKDALSSLNSPLIWMIGIAIMISRSLLKTGLGTRIGYLFLSLFGKSTVGVAYSLALCDLLIAPVTPSNTARGGAIVHPIMKAIATSFDSDPEKGTQNKIGRYLALVNYHANIISCLIFLTATAPNPLVVDLVAKATDSKIHLSWGTWFVAMVVPGMVAMVLMPIILYFLYKPEITSTPDAPEMARAKLKEMGPMSRNEKITLGVFAVLLVLWAGLLAPLGIKVDATTTTFLGISLLLLTGVLTWDDVLKEKGAWDTIVWFAALVMMATFLNKLGLIKWFSDLMGQQIQGMGLSWVVGCALLALVYIYSHYMFASGTAHVTAMLGAFYAVGLHLGAPPMLFALVLAASTGIMMSLTHYASGSSPVIYNSGYTTMGEWWIAGFVMSAVEILIFCTIGITWWKMLGYW
ncbi:MULTISPECIES: DASS family sodium-coupled anion symporter [Kingella]|jgi:transporter, DASS family|uniref:DASS family sodium-coupled anion symporter n=1 Tax=Kingella bonacorsii TaxID=2796361 RepID=A0ABS1BV04_9NEIS|nr:MULTISPECIES: DASS family sodium-coupled anion symporter [Kingella]MBK0397103.1 DASS family sodium-coupled anion symporter [Kingella bonacorsii]RKW32920.1 MAG: DASS family sodium-coupled anion symporter [Kingella sp. (in: b-proteobacteria)]